MKDTITGQITIEPGDTTVNIDALPLPNGAFIKFDITAGRLRVVYADGTQDYLLLEGEAPGGGDMLKTTYDPTNINSSAFSMANMIEGVTQKILTDAERTLIASALQPGGALSALDTSVTGAELDGIKVKSDFLTVSGSVDLDSINTRVNDLDASVILRGSWDASSGSFPGSGTAQAGDSYIVSVAGTVDGVVFSQNDRVIAITDNASTVTFAANWFKADYTDQVLSVAGKTGAVTLDSSDVGLSNVPDTDATNASNISSGTLSPDRIASGVLSNAKLADDIRVRITALTDGATVTPNVNTDGRGWQLTLGGNRTFANPSNLAAGTYVLIVKQDGTGNRTITWGAAYKWPGGVAPTLSTGANAVDIITFVSDGTDLYGAEQLNFS